LSSSLSSSSSSYFHHSESSLNSSTSTPPSISMNVDQKKETNFKPFSKDKTRRQRETFKKLKNTNRLMRRVVAQKETTKHLINFRINRQNIDTKLDKEFAEKSHIIKQFETNKQIVNFKIN
jgi:hypothetical protein